MADDINNPAADPSKHSPAKSPPPSSTPQQSKIGAQSNNDADQKHATAQEMRREFRWFEFGSLVVNGVLAIVGIIALCIYHGQLSVMTGQLAQMQGSSKQTDQLLGLYRQQIEKLTQEATDTHELALQAKNQADASKEIANRTGNQAIATNKLASQTKRSADISQEQQRPYLWAVAVSKKPDGEIFHYSTDVVNDYGLNKQPVEIRVNLVIQNSGHSPATDVISTPPYVGYYPSGLFVWNMVKRDVENQYPAKEEGSIIAPGSFLTIEDALGTKTEISMLHSGYVIALVGSIKYSDLWHKGEFPYETSYCYILAPAPYFLPQLSARPADRIEICPFGNHFK